MEITLAKSHKNKLVRLIHQFQGTVCAFVEDKTTATCFFHGNPELVEALGMQFPGISIKQDDEIDWVEQSALHSPYYQNGRIELPVGADKRLLLLPGPAFGDASHPTTRLCLELLLPCVKNKSVLDIGTGNGVLALASSLMGAQSVAGVDIDPQALAVAERNRILNHIENVSFCSQLPSESAPFDVVVANMTLGDAKVAFPNYNAIFSQTQNIVLSGILEGQEAAIAELLPPPFLVQKRVVEAEWVGLVISRIEKYLDCI